MPSFTANHSDVTVGQFSQRDVTTPRSRHRGMPVENPRLSGSKNHAVAPLLPAGKAGRGQLRSGDSRQKQDGVELLRTGYGARNRNYDDGRGIPQYNHVRRSTARRARTVHVDDERNQRADRRTNDAQEPRQIHRQLSRLLISQSINQSINQFICPEMQ